MAFVDHSRTYLAITLAALILTSSIAAEAQAPPEGDLPLLRRYVPGLNEEMSKLTPFLGDSHVNLHLRSFYFNRLNSNQDSQNEAWAFGGWLDVRSGWLLDTFRMGAVGYTSQPLYNPDGKGGTLLLHAPEEDSIVTLGQAYGQLRYKEYALLTGYRQLIDEGYLNPQDNRMIPNTFEAATLQGKLGPVGYNVGYVTAMKARDRHGFDDMGEVAGTDTAQDRGLILGRLSAVPLPGLELYGATYYVPDVFNTAFGEVDYLYKVTDELGLRMGVQFTDQRSVGGEFLGNFSTINFGARALVLFRGLTAGPIFHITDDGAAISSPYGSWPGYLSLQERDFNRANEKAWGLDAAYNFDKGTLLPFRIPGLTLLLRYAEGHDAFNPVTHADLPRVREGNFDVTWNIPGVKGLSFRFRNAYVAESGDRVVQGFRLILNYELPVL